ncbi:MAG: hypothetical protein E7320_05285 [Clostridiales bacterium]|nr:hypothetical protein [Clostridiales bacterium]
MVEQDTIRLLRECDAGVKMGVDSIESVVERIQSEAFRQVLVESRQKHDELDRELQQLLDRYQDEGKAPDPMAKGMSWMKTNAMLMMKPSDQTIADLMTDGCNMGVKSLHKYLNEYKAADESSKEIAKKLVDLEQKLAVDIRGYL